MNAPNKLVLIAATAPSSWASYLINGDLSGYEDKAEIKAMKAFEREMGGIVSCEENGFSHYHDAYHLFPYGADCETYIALVSPDFEAPSHWFFQGDEVTAKRAHDADLEG